MNNKNTSMIATIAAALLCGCPGLFGLCFGLTSTFASFVPGAEINVLGSNDPRSAMMMGIVTLCFSVIFIAIPVIVWFVTRPKDTAVSPVSEVPPPSEPLPPAS